MNELDRLYHMLVRSIRSHFPEIEQRSFEVAQIYQQIVPYRTCRRELGFASVDEYELALMQLLTGVRGLLTADPEMQEALRAELETPNPDLSAYRAYGTSAVALVPEMARLIPAAGPVSPAGGEFTTSPSPAPMDAAVIASRQTEGLDQRSSPPTPTPPKPASPRPAPQVKQPPGPPRPVDAAPPVPPRSVLDTAPLAPPPSGPPAPRHVPAAPRAAAAPAQTTPISRAVPSPASAPGPTPGEKCRYCGGTLPASRAAVFCPHCGHDLTVQHCPACNSELEVGWKFCITCGRDTR